MNYNEAYKYLSSEIGVTDGLKLLDLISDNKITDGIIFIKQLTRCDDNTAESLWIEFKNKYGTSKTNGYIKDKEKLTVQQTLNIPKCPICQSTNLSKITATKKAMKIAAFGIFGMGDNGKTWKCNNCGSKF